MKMATLCLEGALGTIVIAIRAGIEADAVLEAHRKSSTYPENYSCMSTYYSLM